ncbi:nascent polypeptide-associated complex subunit alpha, muscle-specific form [Drosophila navojoa]|nr:nascent polypeptide-associated complex subunit alpha, muscle-specific form [Drosophila navojoa]
MAVAARSCSGRGQAAIALWLILLLVGDSSNGQAQAATIAATASATTTATQHLKFGVAGDTPTLTATTKHEQQQRQHSSNTTATTAATTAATATVANASSQSITTTTPTTTTEQLTQSVDAVVRLLDLEVTAAPPIGSGHDGLKLTKKKQLQQQHFATAATTTSKLEIDTTDAPSTISTTSTTSTTPDSSTKPELLPVPNGYLGPIFMGEKTFSVAHPLKKPLAPNHQEPAPHDDTIEQQLREGRIVEILAPTALLESNVESSSQRPATTTSSTTTSSSSSSSTTLPAAPHTQSVMSTTVFQVPEPQSSTTRLPMAAAEITVAGSAVLAAPPRTESKISDIQIEVYDSTVDSIVASTNFRDSQGYYPKPLERWPVAGTTKPPSSPMAQERFTQYVIDRADVSTQPAAGMGQAVLGVAGVGGVGKPEPAAIEIHINVSEAFGNESEDLEFSYRQPAAGDAKASKPNDEILVVEIIDNSTENISSASAEHLNLSSMFSYPYHSDAPPPAVRPPQDAADELFMADTKGGDRAGLPRPPPPPPPPPPPLPRKPSIDRDSDTIFYISNTEVKVGESLPTASSSSEQQQQRKLQFENQFFPASYRQDPSQLQSQSQSPSQSERSSAVTARYEEDIILSPQHHTADALKILRSPSSSSDGAPPLDVTYVGESVIEVEQQSVPPLVPASSQQPDIIIQPAVLPDLAIGVPVIGELPPQIELKEIDYMPGELIGQGRSIYENDIESNGLGLSSDPDVIESSIQYGGDLIDDGAGGGFDGVEGSYPFESPAHRLQQQDAEQAQHGLSHQSINHGFSHLHREELPMAELLNATLQLHNESAKGSKSGAASAMAPLLHGERMGNATALSEDPLANYDGFLNLFAVSMGLIIVVLPAGLLTSMYCAVR